MAFNTEELLQLMLGPKVKIWPKSERAHDRLFTFCLQGVSFYERILKLQFERHLQFTAVILLRQSHGFVVLIISLPRKTN